MDTSTIVLTEDIEAAHGFKADAVGRSLVDSQLHVFHFDQSVDGSSTVQTLDDVESQSMVHHDINRVTTASLDGVYIGDYIMMAAVFAMIIFLWVQ